MTTFRTPDFKQHWFDCARMKRSSWVRPSDRATGKARWPRPGNQEEDSNVTCCHSSTAEFQRWTDALTILAFATFRWQEAPFLLDAPARRGNSTVLSVYEASRLESVDLVDSTTRPLQMTV